MKVDIRNQVYKKFNGHCAYCGCELKIQDMQTDHIVPECRGGLYTLTNLNPSCRLCNHYKRADSLEGFRYMMSYLHERVLKIYIVRVAVKYGMLKLEPFDGKFYFEKAGDVK